MYSAPYAADSDSIANTAVKAALLDKLCIDIITRFFFCIMLHISGRKWPAYPHVYMLLHMSFTVTQF